MWPEDHAHVANVVQGKGIPQVADGALQGHVIHVAYSAGLLLNVHPDRRVERVTIRR